MDAIDLVRYRRCFADMLCRFQCRVNRQRDQGRGGLFRCMRTGEERRQRCGCQEIREGSRRIGRSDAEEIAGVSRERMVDRVGLVLCVKRPAALKRNLKATPHYPQRGRAPDSALTVEAS